MGNQKENRTESVNFRITFQNKERLEQIAKEAGFSVGDLIEWWVNRATRPMQIPVEICIAKEGAGRPKPIRSLRVKVWPEFDPNHSHRFTVFSLRQGDEREALLHTDDWAEAANRCEEEANQHLERLGGGYRRYYRVEYDGFGRPLSEEFTRPDYWEPEALAEPVTLADGRRI